MQFTPIEEEITVELTVTSCFLYRQTDVAISCLSKIKGQQTRITKVVVIGASLRTKVCPTILILRRIGSVNMQSYRTTIVYFHLSFAIFQCNLFVSIIQVYLQVVLSSCCIVLAPSRMEVGCNIIIDKFSQRTFCVFDSV